MPSIRKPLIPLAPHATNALGLTVRDYEGSMSTLCAGCGHDSITAAIVQTFFELDTPPELIAKLSGIGCSSKTPTYFVAGAHGFNSVHGRMPPIVTGANAANRSNIHIGISGDGDSLSIGTGHLVHAIRKNVNMVYIIENNGVYGLTKGQFSPTADVGSTTKRGIPNEVPPIDPVELALSLGASFVARSFSGDKKQLIPILKAAVEHHGFALVDVISPCIQFNNHQGSTKSYKYTREHELNEIDSVFLHSSEQITAELPTDGSMSISMHDGSRILFRTLPEHYDPRDRIAAMNYVQQAKVRGEVPTGLLFIDSDSLDIHDLNQTTEEPLINLPLNKLCPGKAELTKFQESFR
ncbi:MAG: 2-oxoacid:ferredoxin oxidoreductase subunit beta [Acidimicrobiaceae bacterium]|nr:2-oxoacid:ferredoxin oxidoreductase subunit beta [Acidimicrobiaceae bacterium]